GGRCGDAARQARAGDLQGVRCSRAGRGGLLRHYPARSKSRRKIAMTTFQEARAFLLKYRSDLDAAVAGFRWPDPVPFNWALDWFDAELAANGDSRDRTALRIVDPGDKETKLSFAALSRRSNQVANFLRAQGLRRADHLLLLLGNVVPLWETMLAAMKL